MMGKVAKVLIIDDQEKYLLLERNNHPYFGNDVDIPGGTVEFREDRKAAAIREVVEEAGIVLEADTLEHLYTGNDYSHHFTEYTLYRVTLDARPEVTISWEHAGYEWVSKATLLEKAAAAKDTFMHMIYAIVDVD